MSFWKNMEKFLYKQIEDVEKKKENIQSYKEQYKRFDDERLLREYKRSSGERRIACAMLLKERGYRNID